MALYLDGVVDELALAGGREIGFIPYHFTSIKLDDSVSLTKAKSWIWENLHGRFGINNEITQEWAQSYTIGFEDPTEASAFTLSMPLMADSLLYSV